MSDRDTGGSALPLSHIPRNKSDSALSLREFRSGIILLDPGHEKVLLVHGRFSKKWGPPKGGCEPGETPAQNAVRECEEETGLRVTLPEGAVSVTIRRQNYFCVVFNDCQECTLRPVDRNEIDMIRWFTWEEIAALPRDDCNAVTVDMCRGAIKTRICLTAVEATVTRAPKMRRWRGPPRCVSYSGLAGDAAGLAIVT